MERYNKKNGFAYFGAVQTNERWSWVAATPEGDKVVITLWKHLMMGMDTERYYDTQKLMDVPASDWQNHRGNNDRIKWFKYAHDNLDSILYVLICRAKDGIESPFEIDYCFPWIENGRLCRVKLARLCEETGHFRVEYLDSVPE